MKSEPDVYSIDDLKNCGKPAMWEGCRNYTVRNFFRDSMQIGDRAFFYHSNAEPSGIVGTMEIVSDAYADPTQFDPSSDYYDSKSDPSNPRWLLRDVLFLSKFSHVISLAQVREIEGLSEMLVLRKGQRLSVMPVTEKEWNLILAISQK